MHTLKEIVEGHGFRLKKMDTKRGYLITEWKSGEPDEWDEVEFTRVEMILIPGEAGYSVGVRVYNRHGSQEALTERFLYLIKLRLTDVGLQ
jgi:hypothetical protein